MKYTEAAVPFESQSEWLLGILTQPEIPSETAVVIIVGGPQYRVGSHRQFVLLSRALADAGFAALRFDYRGMGDSEGKQRDFQAVSADIGAAIGALQDHLPSVRQIALWGLCDGASAALLYCQETNDPRITGLCLLNPWVRSDASLARTQVKHYYTQRMREKEFWAKLFSGRVAASAVSGLARSLISVLSARTGGDIKKNASSYQQKMASAWDNFNGNILLLLSGNDYTAKEFLGHLNADPSWAEALKHPQLNRQDLQMADHTFSSLESHEAVLQLTLGWIKDSAGCLNRTHG